MALCSGSYIMREDLFLLQSIHADLSCIVRKLVRSLCKQQRHTFVLCLEGIKLIHVLVVVKSFMSLVVRKPVFGVSDQVQHKPGCTAKEDG